MHGVQDRFPDDVSGATMGAIFSGHKLERKILRSYDHRRWGPQRLPKRRREIYLAHRAKSPKPKISIILGFSPRKIVSETQPYGVYPQG